MNAFQSIVRKAGRTRSGRGRERAKSLLLTGRGRGRFGALEDAEANADALYSTASSRVLHPVFFLENLCWFSSFCFCASAKKFGFCHTLKLFENTSRKSITDLTLFDKTISTRLCDSLMVFYSRSSRQFFEFFFISNLPLSCQRFHFNRKETR